MKNIANPGDLVDRLEGMAQKVLYEPHRAPEGHYQYHPNFDAPKLLQEAVNEIKALRQRVDDLKQALTIQTYILDKLKNDRPAQRADINSPR